MSTSLEPATYITRSGLPPAQQATECQEPQAIAAEKGHFAGMSTWIAALRHAFAQRLLDKEPQQLTGIALSVAVSFSSLLRGASRPAQQAGHPALDLRLRPAGRRRQRTEPGRHRMGGGDDPRPLRQDRAYEPVPPFAPRRCSDRALPTRGTPSFRFEGTLPHPQRARAPGSQPGDIQFCLPTHASNRHRLRTPWIACIAARVRPASLGQGLLDD